LPEHAELRLTADYVNRVAAGKTFTNIRKNPEHKGKEMEIDFPFSIEAKTKGKELLLELTTDLNFLTAENIQVKHIIMTMGMSGHFVWAEPAEVVKHGHLRFNSSCGGSLYFVDVRRFGRWEWGFWNPDRGPDPVFQYTRFVCNIMDNILKKEFDKPVYEVLMNQKYFNGIGNYLRAEILYRLDIDPFQSTRDIILSGKPRELFELCKTIPEEAYILGGGQLYTWETPDVEVQNTLGITWDEWMKCYGNPNMSTIMDRNGRRFWYDPKWDRN
jgi:endonuclease VIII-like 1